MAFDPDKYLQEKAALGATPPAVKAKGFDPDAYLAEKQKLISAPSVSLPPRDQVPAQYRPMYDLEQQMNQEKAQSVSEAESQPQYKPLKKKDLSFWERSKKIGEDEKNKSFGQGAWEALTAATPIGLSRELSKAKYLVKGEDEPLSPESMAEGQKRFEERREGVGPNSQALGAALQHTANEGLLKTLPYLTGTAEAVSRGIQGNNPAPGAGAWENLKQNIEAEKAVQQLRTQENPKASLAGDIAGILAPSGGFSTINKGVEGVVGASKAVEKGLPIAEKALAHLKNIGKVGTSGAASNVIYDQLSGNDIDPTTSAGLGTAGNLAGHGLGSLIKLAPKIAGKISETIAEPGPIVQRLKGLATKWENPASGWEAGAKEARLSKFSRKLENLAAGQGAADDVAVASALESSVSKGEEALSEKFDKLVNPILEAHGEKAASVNPLREEISNIFRRANLLDANGNFLTSSLEKLPSNDPTRKMFESLAELSGNLKQDPTLGELNLIKKSLQNAAKFDTVTGSPLADVSKRLASVARHSLEENVGKYAGESGLGQFVEGMKEYATKAPVYKSLKKITSKAAEKIPKGVRNLEGSGIVDVIQKAPELKETVSKTLLNHIYETSTNPKKFTQILDKIGRKNLEKIFDTGTVKSFEKIEKLNLSGFQRALKFIPDLIASSKGQAASSFIAGKVAGGGKYAAPIGEKVYKSIYKDGR